MTGGLLGFRTLSGRIGLALFLAFCLLAVAAPWLPPTTRWRCTTTTGTGCCG